MVVPRVTALCWRQILFRRQRHMAFCWYLLCRRGFSSLGCVFLVQTDWWCQVCELNLTLIPPWYIKSLQSWHNETHILYELFPLGERLLRFIQKICVYTNKKNIRIWKHNAPIFILFHTQIYSIVWMGKDKTLLCILFYNKGAWGDSMKYFSENRKRKNLQAFIWFDKR